MRNVLSTFTRPGRASEAFPSLCVKRADVKAAAVAAALANSLVAKGLNRIQRSRFSCRVVAEEDAYRSRKADGDDHDDGGDDRLPSREVAEDFGAGVADEESHHAAE